MNILVTGAAGFVGGHVARDLLAHGHTVRGLDLQPADISGVEWVSGDLRDLEAMERAVDGMDAVCHLAAIPSGRPKPQWPEMWDINFTGTFNVMEAMSRRGVRRIAFASSACVVGAVCNQKYKPKPAYLPFDEAQTVDADHPYPFSKVVNELTGRMFQLQGDFDQAIALRLWNVRGPKGEGLGYMKCKLLFATLHHEDAAQAFRLAVESDLRGFHAFCVGSRWRYNADGSRQTPEEIRAEIVEEGLQQIELREGFPEHWSSSASSAKLMTMLGYDPKY